MVNTIQAKQVTLRLLIDQFGLQWTSEPQSTVPWKAVPLERLIARVSELEKEQLERIAEGFINLLNTPPVLEGVVRMSVVDPLLFLVGFYLPPFQVRSEESVQLESHDGTVVITGSLDTLVLQDKLWITVVESKRAIYSTEAGLAQILAYLLSSPNARGVTYGLITNGSSFMFIQLVTGEMPQYATSRLFSIREKEDLQVVFAILKGLAEEIAHPSLGLEEEEGFTTG